MADGILNAKEALLRYKDSIDTGNVSVVKFSKANQEMTYTIRTLDN